LKNEHAYDYQIRAFNKYCHGAWSNTTAIITGMLPSAPTTPIVKTVPIPKRFGASSTGNTHLVRVTWKPPRNKIKDKLKGYQVFIFSEKENDFLIVGFCNGRN